MTLGSRVAVMREGRIEQVAPPVEVYARPTNTFVAQFMGSPAMNLVHAPVPGVTAPAHTLVGIRPHDISIAPGGAVRASVDLVEPRGHDAIVAVSAALPGGVVPLTIVTTTPPLAGSDVAIDLPADRVHLFDAETGQRLNESASLTARRSTP